MSAASTANLASPIEHRDIRGASLAYKRAKDSREKWSNGQRPLCGVRINYYGDGFEEELIGGTESMREKVRPRKQVSQAHSEHKSHANRTPNPHGFDTWTHGRAGHRIVSKSEAVIDANDHTQSTLSESLLELLPQHVNNATPSVKTTDREAGPEILYSFDNKGPSPNANGRAVDLGGLIEQAEKKWESAQTDKMVRGEYEVLDLEGETTVLATQGKKKRGSPKQKAVKVEMEKKIAVEDEDYELV